MEQSETEDEEDSFNNKPQQCDFTRCSLQSESVHFSRIDRILTNHNISKLTSNIYKIDAANESDHDTMKIVLQNRMDYPNKAQWYMNNELTDNPKYVEEFTKEWNKNWTNSISKLG